MRGHQEAEAILRLGSPAGQSCRLHAPQSVPHTHDLQNQLFMLAAASSATGGVHFLCGMQATAALCAYPTAPPPTAHSPTAPLLTAHCSTARRPLPPSQVQTVR